MKKDVYIFIGQSGAGKGTQAKLLKEKLTIARPEQEVLYLEVGSQFRKLIKEESLTATRVGSLMAQGKLPPSFIGVHMWSHELIDQYTDTQAVIIDGTPRVSAEVPILLSACEFYGWTPTIINIRVSDEWAYERTKARGRDDDKDERDVWGRIEWYHQSVEPATEMLRGSELVVFHDVNGEQSIEAVHKDICEILGM